MNQKTEIRSQAMKSPGSRTLKKLSWALAASSLLSVNAFAATGGVPQASINLSGATLSYCNTSENSWTITKTANVSTIESPGDIEWTVVATKNGSSTPVAQPNAQICAEGTITIANGGQAPATIGNIVVNLQKNALVSGKNRWVSAAADVATAASGDAATSAWIVSSASAEDPALNCVSPNATACNYTVSGAGGKFKETTGISGTLEFTDVSDNTIWALNPPKSIPLSTPVTLKYKAIFTNKVFDIGGNVIGGMKLPDGASLRTEIIVSFGNAGGRGGSGASATGIDINGDGDNTNDGNVRSVPVRLTSVVPGLVNCNSSITLEDVLTATGTVTYGANSGALPTDPISESGTFTVTSHVLSGSGTISNTVDFVGSPNHEGDACCTTDEGTASATVEVTENDCNIPGHCVQPPPRCDEAHPELCPQMHFCTYSQGGWFTKPSGSNPGKLLADNFSTAFPGGLVVGNLADGGLYTMTFTTSTAVSKFHQGGKADVLNATLVNPTSSHAGNFGSQMTALTISLNMSNAGATPSGFGALTVSTVAGPMTISQFVAAASTTLSGGGLGVFPSVEYLTGLTENLNLSFHECQKSGWAAANLSNSN
jgi:hypothetical protein